LEPEILKSPIYVSRRLARFPSGVAEVENVMELFSQRLPPSEPE
jgi:hypothetical protein